MHTTPDAAFERGRLLRSQRRTDDAIEAFKQALEIDANHSESYTMLALCWTEKEGCAEQANDAARRAVAIEPESAFARAILALTLHNAAKAGQKGKLNEALIVAKEAVALDPDLDVAYAVQASIHLQLEQRAEAEVEAKHALALNPDNTMAGEILSAALLLQRKESDNSTLIEAQLRRTPDDDSAHSSAGWQALMSGDHKTANKHFTEALRLNPMNEHARLGLIESFRARSKPYQLQLRFANYMNQFTSGKQTAIMIGGFIFYKIAYNSVSTFSPFLGNVILGCWLVFALWSHLARGLGTFFIVFDRFARRALRTFEKWEGIAVGGCIFLSLATLLAGLIIGAQTGGHLALIFLFAGICNAAAFTNDHHLGKYVYFAAAALTIFAAFYNTTGIFFPSELPLEGLLFSLGILSGVAVSWLRGLGVGYA